jgi:hypothetical protein
MLPIFVFDKPSDWEDWRKMEAPVCYYVVTLLFLLLQWVGTGLSQVAWTPIYVDGNSK